MLVNPERLLKNIKLLIDAAGDVYLRKELGEFYIFVSDNLHYLKEARGIHDLFDDCNPNLFWKKLQLVIGTNEDVQIRREVNEMYMYALNVSHQTCEYMSGSKGEGFLFSWSDIDVMASRILFTISMESSNSECFYVATRSGCQPGFCRIRKTLNDDRNVCYYYFLSRGTFISSIEKQHFNENVDHTNRGPCLSTKYPDGFDRCVALPVHIDSSNRFLKTFHTTFWNSVKSKILNDRVTVMHCVPKGPEKGDEEERQWLISFSVLERYIVHSFNHVQFCCYGLMKILLHTVLDLNADTNDTISSYHIKTVLFHVLEDIHQEFWIPQNIFHCVRICLTRLLLFLFRGCCPNYFIPESNLFVKSRVIQRRCKIQHNLCEVYFCKNSYFTFTLSLYFPINITELEFESYALRKFCSLCLALNLVKGYQTTYRECIHSVLNIMHLLALQDEENNVRTTALKYTWLLIMRRIGVIMYDKYVLTGFPMYLMSAEVALMFAQHANVFSSIYLASLWYSQGRYKHCLKLLYNVTVNMSPIFLNSIVYNESLKTKCREVPCDYSLLIRHHYRKVCVDMHRTSHLFPKDIENFVKTCKVSEFIVFDKAYAYFLLFLCYHDMHKRAGCSRMLSSLQESYKEFQRISFKGDLHVQNTKILVDIAETKMKNIH